MGRSAEIEKSLFVSTKGNFCTGTVKNGQNQENSYKKTIIITQYDDRQLV